MRKRSSIKRSRDENENAMVKSVFNGITNDNERDSWEHQLQLKNPAAVALGRLGGLKGGKARAAVLSPEERSKIAKNAALARWKKEKG